MLKKHVVVCHLLRLFIPFGFQWDKSLEFGIEKPYTVRLRLDAFIVEGIQSLGD